MFRFENRLYKSTWPCIALAVFATMLAVLPPSASAAEDGSAPWSYIPEESFAVVVIRIDRLLDSKLAAKLPLGPLLERGAKKGFDYSNFESIVEFFGPRGQSDVGGVMRFKKAVDVRKDKMFNADGPVVEKQYNGLTYLVSRGDDAFFQPAPKTVLFAESQALLRRMIDADDVKSRLVATLKEADLKHSVIMIGVPPAKNRSDELPLWKGRAPSSAGKFAHEFFKTVERINVTVDVDPIPNVQAEVLCTSHENAAALLAQARKKQGTLAKSAKAKTLSEGEKPGFPFWVNGVLALPIVEPTILGTKITQKDRTVSVDLRVRGDWDAIVKMAAKKLSAAGKPKK